MHACMWEKLLAIMTCEGRELVDCPITGWFIPAPHIATHFGKCDQSLCGLLCYTNQAWTEMVHGIANSGEKWGQKVQFPSISLAAAEQYCACRFRRRRCSY